MKRNKLMTATALSLALLAMPMSISAMEKDVNFKAEARNIVTSNTVSQSDESNVIIVTKGSSLEDMEQISFDGGETWQDTEQSNLKWTTLTVEDIETQIAAIKQDMLDDAFMHMMAEQNDLSKEDMEQLLDDLQCQIVDIKNGVIIQEAVTSDGLVMVSSADDVVDMMQ